jgi:arginase
MRRSINVVGAPSSIGIRPYDDGSPRRLDLAPSALREQGLVARLGARDLGDVLPPPYRDFARPAGRPRNEREVGKYSRSLARRVDEATDDGAFALVLGGDCSIVLGCLLGLRGQRSRPVGLGYIDAHADFGTPEESRTGSAASMCLGLAVGRGDTPLARLASGGPLVAGDNVALIGRRDDGEPWYGHDALRASPILDLRGESIRERGTDAVAVAALERLARPALDGFWIHVDMDVLDPAVLPAVDSPTPGGLTGDDLSRLLRPLAHHPQALGMEVTIYDPELDPSREGARRLADLLEQVLAGNASG